MHATSRPWRIVVLWVAALATLMGAMAPAAAQAGWVPGASPADICSAVPAKAGADGRLADPTRPPGDGLAHCPYCLLHVPAAGLPAGSPALLPSSSRAALVPPLLLTAPRLLFAWAGARPRAPPFSC